MLKLVLVAALVLLGGCSGPAGTGTTVRSVENAPVERLDYLGAVEEAHWVNDETKKLGGDVAGPWQQGVARLTEAEFGRLRNSQDWQLVSTAPIIPADLKDKLAFGNTWSMGETEHGTFYLESDTHSIVFIVYE